MVSFSNSLVLASLVPSHHNLTYHLIVILLSALAAFIPRYFPMRFFTNRKIPEWFNEWMKYVPVSLFTALVVKGIFVDSKYRIIIDHVHLFGNTFTVYGLGSYLVAAVCVGLVAYFTRSMLSSVIVGLGVVWLLSITIGV